MASFVFVPVYIHVLGMEVFGLIALFTSIHVVLSLLDLGLSAAATRELARLSAYPASAGDSRQFLRSLELVYWSIGAVIALVLCVAAPSIAEHWITPEKLSLDEAGAALMLMGIALAARWPFTLYIGALVGLERQVLANTVRVTFELARSGGGAALLLWVAPTLEAFLFWQVSVSAIASTVAAFATWRVLPPADVAPRFEWDQLRRVWRYLAGVSGISVTVVILTQIDKLVLSKLLPLEVFGYYALAWAVANALTMLTAPVFSGYFPSFTRSVTKADGPSTRDLFRRGSQTMAAIIIPAGIVLAFFSREILTLWTQNGSLAAQSHLILSVLVLGSLLNGLMNIPYALMLAHGWTSLPFLANALAIVLVVPLVIVMASLWGALGAAFAWLALNLGHLVLTQHVMYRRILPSEKWPWYKEDVLVPLAVCVSIAALARFLLPELAGIEAVIVLAAVMMASQIACLSVLQRIRLVPVAVLRRMLR
jgi:O-antigen/teichoic acid export membrane protein